MTEPGLPLTTGEGATTRENVNWLLAECGRLREQLAAQQKRAENLEQRGSEFAAMAVESEEVAGRLREQLAARDKAAKEEAHWHVHYAAEAAAQKNRADALREQLDAARQALGELDAELDRYDGLWQDETRKVDPNYARIVQIEAHQNGLRWARERFARAALGVEGPAE